MKTLRLHKFIAITLCVTLLAVSAGKVTRVSAVGTTATIAGTAFILTGAVYLSYVALTHGEMILPAAEEMHDWLGSIGRKVSQFPSGSAAYQEIYQGLARSPVGNVIDGVWSWTQDKIRSFANDFTDTRLIDNILSYERALSADSQTPTTNFDYSYIPTYFVQYSYNNQRFTLDQLLNFGMQYLTYEYTVVIENEGYGLLVPIVSNGYSYRNILRNNNTYGVQAFINGNWTEITQIQYGVPITFQNMNYINVGVWENNAPVGVLRSGPNTLTSNGGFTRTYPLIGNAPIYVSATDETIEVIPVEGTEIVNPSWNDPDNDNRPIIPWVPIPQLPVNVTPPSGYVNPQWGFNLQDLLDELEYLAGQLIDIGGIAGLINEFAGLHGDEYYIEYNVGDTNYFTYYQPTVYDNDTQYVTYNIDVSDIDEKLPVDLNTIQIYTKNRYLDEVKRSAIAGSSIIRDLVVFVYDIDPGIVYVFFGSCIAILVAAFIGKWGHS